MFSAHMKYKCLHENNEISIKIHKYICNDYKLIGVS